jgi:Undecaprenyl-phosphate glucose phosphotransferase
MVVDFNSPQPNGPARGCGTFEQGPRRRLTEFRNFWRKKKSLNFAFGQVFMSIEIVAQPGKRAGLNPSLRSAHLRLSKTALIAAVLLFDLLAFWGLGFFATMGRPFESFAESIVLPLTIALVPILAVYILQRLWAYTIPSLRSFPRQIRALVQAFAGAFVLVMGLYFTLNINMLDERNKLLLWALTVMCMLVPFRFVVSRVVAAAEQRGELARRAVIVGGGRACEDLIERLEKKGERAIRILGLFDDRGDERSPDEVGRYRKIGTFEELESYCRENAVDLLIIALPPAAEGRILHLLKKLWQLPVDVRIAAHSSKLKFSKRAYTYIGDVPFFAVFDRPLSDWNAAMKAMFDRVIAAIALLLLMPVMLVVALAIRLDSKGPVLFRQRRFGFNNEPIEVYKFRSMHTHLTDHNAAKLATRDDPRITRVGRFIRRTSLDELPQLFNVVFDGNLSLVGPRPHAFAAKAGDRLYEEVIDGYFARHRVKPGMTGWAQVNGWRGETDTSEKLQKRVEHDLHYIENWSLGFDLYILAVTPFALVNTRNAY